MSTRVVQASIEMNLLIDLSLAKFVTATLFSVIYAL